MEVGKFIHFGPGLEGFGKILSVEKENDLFIIDDYAEGLKRKKKISSNDYEVVDRPSNQDLLELSAWNFSLFKELYKENPFSLNVRENPIVTNTGNVIDFDDLDGYDFYGMVFTGYCVIRKKNLRNALFLIKHNANISSYTWKHFLNYLISPFEKSNNSFYDKERRKIAELDHLITEVILGLIRVGADPFVFSEEDEDSLDQKKSEVQRPFDQYPLFKALSIIGNKRVIEELSKNPSIVAKIWELGLQKLITPP